METPSLGLWPRRFAWSMAGFCLVLLLLEGPAHRDPDFHPQAPWEAWWGFVPALSFGAAALVGCAARSWQWLLHRDEGYYRD
jgi:hypothetical protein